MTPPTHRARALTGSLAVLALDLALLTLGVGGFSRLAHHARALALFATWAVATPALARVRPPRARDPVAARPDHAVMAVLVLAPLLTPCLSAWCERRGLAPLPGGPALHWGGVALSAAGLALRIAAMRQLGSRFSPMALVQREHALETNGLYGVIRHPGYLGSLASTLGIVLAFGSAVTLALVAVMAVATGARVANEERLLDSSFGDEYRAYQARVGAFLPRPPRRVAH